MATEAAEEFGQRIERGLACRARRDFSGATEQFRVACDLRPDSIGARCELAFTYLKAGALDESWTCYLAAHATDATNVDALIGLGQISRERGQLPVALDYLQEAAARDPSRPALGCELATLLRDLARFDEAARVLDGVLAIDPGNWSALVELGLLKRRRGEHLASAGLFRRACASFPEHLGIQLELALSLRQAGATDEAAALYRGVLARDRAQSDAVMGLAACARRRDDLLAAAEHLREIAAHSPGKWEFRLELASLLRRLARPDEADAQYRVVLDADPTCWPALVGRALVARQQEDHAVSLHYLRLAMSFQPAHVGIQAEMAFTLRLLNRLDEAEALYRAAIDTGARDPALLFGLSAIASARGAFDTALALAQSACALDTANLDNRLILCATYRALGRLADAAHLIAEILPAAAEHCDAWMEHGQILRAQNDRVSALAAFEHAATLDHRRGVREVARELLALGRPDEARAIHAALLVDEPACFAAMTDLAEIDMLAADYQGCIALCDAAIAAHPRRALPYQQKSRALILLDRDEPALRVADALAAALPDSVEAAALRMQTLRVCGRHAEALALLGEPPFVDARAFPLWFECLLTRLAVFDLDGAGAMLRDPPALLPPERARVLDAQAMLADLQWRVTDAIAASEAAIALDPAGFAAHDRLARLYFLQADSENASHHLRRSREQSASALRLRRQSHNPSQTLIGQLLNEMRLEPSLASGWARWANEDPLRQAERLRAAIGATALTPPALWLLRGLRQTGAFAAAEPADDDRDPAIPRRIMQYWHESRPPEDITRLLRTWSEAHPGYQYCRFDHATAVEYLASSANEIYIRAYLRARHPAQACDLFRLAYLFHEGGYYVDADERCVGHLSAVASAASVLIVPQQEYAEIGNNFIGCRPGEPVIGRALTLAVQALIRGDADNVWLSTGPGLLSRVFAEILSGQGAKWRHWLAPRRVLDRAALAGVARTQANLTYKAGPRGQPRSLFQRNGPESTALNSAGAEMPGRRDAV